MTMADPSRSRAGGDTEPPSTSEFHCNRKEKEFRRVPDNRKPVVLLVDDEDMILTSIRTLLMLEADYEVVCFTNPADAARHLETNQVDITVSDYMMPGLNGIQLLGEAKPLQPEATRVLLTGHAD